MALLKTERLDALETTKEGLPKGECEFGVMSMKDECLIAPPSDSILSLGKCPARARIDDRGTYLRCSRIYAFMKKQPKEDQD